MHGFISKWTTPIERTGIGSKDINMTSATERRWRRLRAWLKEKNFIVRQDTDDLSRGMGMAFILTLDQMDAEVRRDRQRRRRRTR